MYYDLYDLVNVGGWSPQLARVWSQGVGMPSHVVTVSGGPLVLARSQLAEHQADLFLFFITFLTLAMHALDC